MASGATDREPLPEAACGGASDPNLEPEVSQTTDPLIDLGVRIQAFPSKEVPRIDQESSLLPSTGPGPARGGACNPALSLWNYRRIERVTFSFHPDEFPDPEVDVTFPSHPATAPRGDSGSDSDGRTRGRGEQVLGTPRVRSTATAEESTPSPIHSVISGQSSRDVGPNGSQVAYSGNKWARHAGSGTPPQALSVSRASDRLQPQEPELDLDLRVEPASICDLDDADGLAAAFHDKHPGRDGRGLHLGHRPSEPDSMLSIPDPDSPSDNRVPDPKVASLR